MSFIKDYPNTFLLKSGTEVIVLDLLSFNVGSDDCRNEIELNRDEIISFLQDLFIQKSVEELSTPSGVDFLKRQIRDEINLITGFAGEKEEAGVLEVFLHILSLTSVQY
jgi:flagellar FliL protein